MNEDNEEINLLRKDVDHLKEEVKGLKAIISVNQIQKQKKTPYGSVMLGIGLILIIIGISLIVITHPVQSVGGDIFIFRIIGIALFVLGIIITVKGIKRLR